MACNLWYFKASMTRKVRSQLGIEVNVSQCDDFNLNSFLGISQLINNLMSRFVWI